MKTSRFIIHEPADAYHARSRSGEFLSSHLLLDFMDSPALYDSKISGAVEPPESPAFIMGRAAHTLILEGKTAFDAGYEVSDGPLNPKTGEPFGKGTKAYSAWKSQLEREAISPKDYAFLLKLRASVERHDAASHLLSIGEAEGVVRASILGVPCQIRMDWFSPDFGIADLKTCDSLKWFAGDASRYGYILQMAFYRAVLREASGETFPVHFIAVEKSEPNSTGVWFVTGAALDEAERIVLAAIGRFKECKNSGSWPTGYEEIRTIDRVNANNN